MLSSFSTSWSSSSSSSHQDRSHLVSSLQHLYAFASPGLKSDLSTAKSWSTGQLHSSAVTLRRELLSSTTVVRVVPGDVYSSIGKRDLAKFEDSALEKVHYCVRGLDFLRTVQQSSQAIEEMDGIENAAKEIRSLINHAFLVVEMHNTDGQKFYIRAEKVAAPEKCAGIHFSKYDDFPNDKNQILAFTMACNNKAISPTKVVDILEDSDPNYCLKNSCCWDYARDTAIKLLEACAALAKVSENEKARLRGEIDAIPSRVIQQSFKNVPFVLERYFELIKGRIKDISNKSDELPWLQD